MRRPKRSAKLKFSYDAAEDILVVEGIRFSGELFRKLAQPDDGQTYRLIQDVGGVVIIQRTEPTYEDKLNQAFDEEAGSSLA